LLDAAYIRDNTLVGELQQTGVVNRRTQRNWWNAHPQWKHSVTDRLTLDVEYQFTTATYQNAVQFNLFDYTTHLGSVGADYKLTEKDVMSLAGYYQTYEAPFLNLDARYYGLQLALAHRFTETFRANLGGGFRNIQTTQSFLGSSGQSTDLVWVFNASTQKQFERSEASLGFSREIYPSGVGFLVQTDHLSASIRQNMTPTLWASLSADVYWITPTLSPAVIPNSQYLYIQPMLHYRWSEWWSVELSYRHARLDVEVVDTTATQNSVYLSITWNVPKVTWSW
jgi:hypothetical protein